MATQEIKNINDLPGPIGVFDSGYGGLTILRDVVKKLPHHDFIYLGDNARTPYGTRSFDVVLAYTLQAVKKLFSMGCHLVILACNTASAKALRTIQQSYLPVSYPNRRVLGVIHPSVEVIGRFTKTNHVGVMGTTGTILSESYPIEINKLFPGIKVSGEACPMWVPLVENGEANSPGADYFVKQHTKRLMDTDPEIDTIILGCTHYPLLLDKINKYLPKAVTVISQGEVVANSLKDYLLRHPEIDANTSKQGTVQFFTTEQVGKFEESANAFLDEPIRVQHITL